MSKRWYYCGDINIENGGYYWQESGYADSVYIVSVICMSDIGAADNEFFIQSGSVFIGDDKKIHASALATIGKTLADYSRHDLIDAMFAYRGIEQDQSEHIRIGKPDYVYQNPSDLVTHQLRGNASLRRYIRREYMGLSN